VLTDPTAAVIVIGNEILSGKVDDQNARYLIGELRALGAPWLSATYQQNLPAPLDGLDQLLHSLADGAEAAGLLSLPVHWPGMPPVFDRDASPLVSDELTRSD